MAAGLVDRAPAGTLFPVITESETERTQIFQGAADFDLRVFERPESRRSDTLGSLPPTSIDRWGRGGLGR